MDKATLQHATASLKHAELKDRSRSSVVTIYKFDFSGKYGTKSNFQLSLCSFSIFFLFFLPFFLQRMQVRI